MTMQYTLASLDHLDEALHSHYTEQDDGTFVLSIEGHNFKTEEDVTRVQEALRKERDNHKETKTKLRAFGTIDADGLSDKLARLEEFGELDPGEVQDKLDKFVEMEAVFDADGNLKDEKIEALVNARAETRVKKAEREKERDVTKMQKERDELKTQLDDANSQITVLRNENIKRSISGEIGGAIDAIEGFLPAAKKDAIALGEALFHIEDNKVVARDSSGLETGTTPKDWLMASKETRPYWFGESKGGGSRPGRGTESTVGSDNPWSKDQWNFTQQSRIMRESPEKAEKLAKAVGSRVGAISPPA